MKDQQSNSLLNLKTIKEILIILLLSIIIIWLWIIGYPAMKTYINDNINTNKINIKDIPENAVKWDFNGDWNLDYMQLIEPELDLSWPEWKCSDWPNWVDNCFCEIKFSDTNIPNIKIENCIWWIPVNEWDLNNNWTDEIWLLPERRTSYWRAYYVFTLSNNKRINAVDPIETHSSQWEAGVKPIEPDYYNKNNVIIRYTDWETFEIKSKSIKIK